MPVAGPRQITMPRTKKRPRLALLTIATLTLLSILPFRFSQAMGTLVGWVNWLLDTQAAKVTLANLRVCLPELDDAERDELARQSLMQTGQTLAETPRIWLGNIKKNRHLIRAVEGGELLDSALAENRGVILILPHLGNWELVNVYFGEDVKMTALYQSPRIQELGDFLKKTRSRYGNDMIPAGGISFRTAARTLKEGGIVTVLPDQVPSDGAYASFFGVDALTDVFTSRLVQRVNPEVLCVFMKRLSGAGFCITFRPVEHGIFSKDLPTSLAALNKSIQNCVEEIREQYQWEYKRFKERPAGEAKLYRFNKPPGVHR